MKQLLYSGLGLAALCLALPLASGSLTAERVAQDPVEIEETELDKDMLEVKAKVRSLRRSLRDPAQNEASLADLQILETRVLTAKARIPRNTKDLPEAERAAYVLAYRADMITFLSTALAVESSLLAGDQEAAQEHFKSFRAQEDPAHEKFTDEG